MKPPVYLREQGSLDRIVNAVFTARMDNTPLDRAIAVIGSASLLAEKVGVTKQAITYWRVRGVPATKVLKVEELTHGRVTRYELRPDVFGTSAGQ